MTGGSAGPRATVAPPRRLLAVLGLGLVPWTVLSFPGGVDLVFLWGLANPATGHVVGLHDYLFAYTSGLPDRLLAWPAGSLCYLAGLLAVLGEGRVHEDRRLAAGLLGLAALAHLGFALGLAGRGGPTVVPPGPLLAGGLAWWCYVGPGNPGGVGPEEGAAARRESAADEPER